MHPLSGRRVLLVEDEAIIALDLAALLTDLGAVVVGPAHSVANALELLHEGKIDCAVLDVNLDGEPVYPVARALETRRIPFVFVTAHSGESSIRSFRTVQSCKSQSTFKNWSTPYCIPAVIARKRAQKPRKKCVGLGVHGPRQQSYRRQARRRPSIPA
jgi:CheY-like chemotaxis protein